MADIELTKVLDQLDSVPVIDDDDLARVTALHRRAMDLLSEMDDDPRSIPVDPDSASTVDVLKARAVTVFEGVVARLLVAGLSMEDFDAP